VPSQGITDTSDSTRSWQSSAGCTKAVEWFIHRWLPESITMGFQATKLEVYDSHYDPKKAPKLHGILSCRLNQDRDTKQPIRKDATKKLSFLEKINRDDSHSQSIKLIQSSELKWKRLCPFLPPHLLRLGDHKRVDFIRWQRILTDSTIGTDKAISLNEDKLIRLEVKGQDFIANTATKNAIRPRRNTSSHFYYRWRTALEQARVIENGCGSVCVYSSGN